MSKDFAFLAGFAVGMIIAFFISVVMTMNSYTDREAVSHNCAQYNSKTGEFEWIDTIKTEAK